MNRLKHAHLKVPRISEKDPLTEEIRRKAFSEEGVQILISQRSLLITKNLTDGEISRELSKLIDHPVKSIEEKIRNLVKSAHLPENPNKKEQSDFSDQDLQNITSQRALLVTKNLTDKEISRELSKLIDRSATSIDSKIRRLVKSGQLPENPNKQEHEGFTDEELQTITSQRTFLIAKNLADKEISRELSKLVGHPARSIEAKTRNLVKSGQMHKNPNKQEHEVFTDQELQTIFSQRALLITKNLTDHVISRELSKLIDHSALRISHKIRKLVKSGQLPENPNKKEQADFSEQELQTITSQRPSLIAKNLTDGEISRELSKLIDRSPGGIRHKIHNLVKSGQLPDNPNKKGQKFSDDELLGQLTDAVDAYTGEKNE